MLSFRAKDASTFASTTTTATAAAEGDMTAVAVEGTKSNKRDLNLHSIPSSLSSRSPSFIAGIAGAAAAAAAAIATKEVTASQAVLHAKRSLPDPTDGTNAIAKEDHENPGSNINLPLTPCVSRDQWSEAKKIVREKGVCVVKGVFPASAAIALSAKLNELPPRRTVNRRRNRFERVHAPTDELFRTLAECPIVTNIVKSLLGKDYYVEKAGVMISYPGSDAQRWHCDVPHLFRVPTHLPPHTLATFVALTNVDARMGPTEFYAETHIKSKLAKLPRSHLAACCEAGDFIIYDPRILHRGGANRGKVPRPLAYLTFSRVWFRDTVNP